MKEKNHYTLREELMKTVINYLDKFVDYFVESFSPHLRNYFIGPVLEFYQC